MKNFVNWIAVAGCLLAPCVCYGQYQLLSVEDFLRERVTYLNGANRYDAENGARTLLKVAARMEVVSNVSPRLVIGDTPTLNAQATDSGGFPVVMFTLGMLQMLGDDEDAAAFVYGHELAHFRAGHLRATVLLSSILETIGRVVVMAIDERYKTKLAPNCRICRA